METKRVGLAALWTAMLLGACLVPGYWLHEEEVRLPPAFPHLDKVVHAGLFLGFALAWAWALRRPGATLRIAGVGLFLAVFTEWAQGLPVVARDPDVLDVLADAAGLLVGLGFARWRLPPSSPACPPPLQP